LKAWPRLRTGAFLYPLLEGPVWNADAKDWEKEGAKEYLRILEFDVQANSWTGRHWKYVLEQNGAAIGDINMIDAGTALVIERDNGEGVPERACPEGQRRTDCFHDLPKLKRVYKIEMGDAQVGKPVRKIGYVDLLRIADPDKKARKPLTDGAFAFPFFTIENVDVVDGTHIIVGNDNNLPVLVEPRAEQGRRQRVRAPRRAGTAEGEVGVAGLTRPADARKELADAALQVRGPDRQPIGPRHDALHGRQVPRRRRIDGPHLGAG
jgi:hypothetical protein